MIAGVNVIAADTDEAGAGSARGGTPDRGRRPVRAGGQSLTDDEADLLVRQGAGQHVDQMLTYAAVGTPHEVADYLEDFQTVADADELITAHQARSPEGRLRSVTLTAEAMESAAA